MMRQMAGILRELLGLFVDDVGFSLTILLCLTAIALLPDAPVLLSLKGLMLFLGLVASLVGHCLRHVGRRTP
jgi:hypothetical protein